jgi:NAD(P)-dependent dehydrogenase (short-subunit alcohol dehydrogenase family)
VALITGASGGLGAALARALRAKGCRLFLTGRSSEKLASVAGALAAPKGEVEVAAADLRDAAECDRTARRAETSMGKVDILVAAAGVFSIRRLEDSTPEEFDAVFAINVRAPFGLARALAPGMAARGWGRIVLVGSSSSYEGFPETSLYCASKHALLGLSRSLHKEWRDRGVRVLCVSPGSIKTPMGRQLPHQEWETFLEPDDVADWIVRAAASDGNLFPDELRLNRIVRS